MRVSRGLQRIKCRRNRDSPGISILALWGRQEVFPLLCQDNPWQLLASSGRYRTNPRERQFSPFQSSDCQAGDGRAQVAAADLPATAAAMIITSWVGMSRPWTAPIQMPPKHFQQNFMDDRLVALIKIDDEGKKAARARAIPQPGKTARSALSQIRRGPYELRSICARSSAIEPNLTVPSGSLASIEPSV